MRRRSILPGRRQTQPSPSDDFWSRSAEASFASLRSEEQGLSAQEAARRLRDVGRNIAVEPVRRRILAKIGKRLIEPLIAILIVAALISGATGDWASFGIILSILAISIALDVTQEHRAEKVAEALKQSVAVRAQVKRGGRPVGVPVENIVPGDIVLLRAGDLVPADGILLESRAAHANEALLTGEPFPVEKRPGPSAAATPAEAFNALFGGTALVSGEATMLVVATGARTRFGGIAAALRSEEPPTSFERGLHAFGVLILRITAFLVLFVLLANLALHRPVLESFLFAVALAVGLTPELMPMIMTVTLSRGAVRMAARKVVVKRLAAIHDLGAMDVLCTDKTGTLTEASIDLVAHPGFSGEDSERVIEFAAVNSRFESGVKSALDDAILAHTQEKPLDAWRKIADVPFDFERRRVSVLVENSRRRLLIVKGAPEEILARCSRVDMGDGVPVPLDEEKSGKLQALLAAKSEEGLRCLGIAWRDMPEDRAAPAAKDEQDLVFVGYCVFVDPPKASAAEAIRRLERAGVRIAIVSGDAAPVLRHIVETLGIPAKGMLTGADIAGLGDAALAARVAKVDLFARVSPDQKTRIVRALQARGHTVGFIGDGINDAPAIKAADAGLSVDGASDVARAAADLILLEHDLGVVADGVAEGRRTYANIMKYVRMGTSSNFGNMLSMAFASLFLPFLPLTPIQVLLNNLLYDVSETGIPFDDVDETATKRPHSWNMHEVLRFSLIMGPLSSLFDIATFVILLHVFGASAEVFRTGWFLESMATQILVVFLIRTALPAWISRPNRALVATSLGSLGLAILLALSPVGHWLGFFTLPWPILLSIAALIGGYLLMAEFLKRLALAPQQGRSHQRRR
ncbi:Mg2+-importing ATPase [Microvirga flocculans]|uniref:Magnesium-transporting ATPase, P-type 1 n=1 Tax=Microvirga flocculans TaxID=217168 RepID=A0A7W6N6X1_9HYPH|nr:magnesium-translocating P-type ATPase [Microvirga flocculans]MBB4038733.1 Mg2+-importing ATPase [Microvirga flocculans]